MADIKLNIGCGPSGQIDGFVNIDNSKAVLLHRWPSVKRGLYKIGLLSKQKLEANWDDVRYVDASRRLPYRSESVAKIYSSHFLEHVPAEKGQKVLRECYRTLIPGGVMRLVLPDLLWHAERYVQQTTDIVAGSPKNYSTQVHDRFLNTVYGAYLEPARFGHRHCYMYDFPTIYCLLSIVGFRDIRQYQYRTGPDEDLWKNDCRPEDSMHLECAK